MRRLLSKRRLLIDAVGRVIGERAFYVPFRDINDYAIEGDSDVLSSSPSRPTPNQ